MGDEDKSIWKILAGLIVLVMVTSCIMFCIAAVDDSTDNTRYLNKIDQYRTSEDQIIAVNCTPSSFAAGVETTATSDNIKLYLTATANLEDRCLSEYIGRVTEGYSVLWPKYGDTSRTWGYYYLNGDIRGTSYSYRLDLMSGDPGISELSTTFKIEIIINGITVATFPLITVQYDPEYQPKTFSGTVTGLDPTTSSGDEVALKITIISGDIGTIYYGSIYGSYITIPPLAMQTIQSPTPTPKSTPTPPSIQSMIDAANPGDTILIEDGIYNDDYINVNKRLTIRSENGPSNCIVQAINPKAPVFEVSADYVNISGLTVKGADNGTRLFHADYCNISNNNFLYNDVGIYLSESNSSSISNNTCSNNNGDGIYLSYSSNNTISGNNVRNNNHSIALHSSSNNHIYLNNFINNTDNVYSYASTNIWNSIEEITYTYLGTTYESYVGNYWDDYKEKYPDAEEIDSTGIWDTPYIIDGDEDNYPLMEPWENYIDTSHGPTKILFSDDFSDEDSGWVTYDEYDGRVIYEDGCLYVTDYTNPEFAMYGESQRYFTDFIIEVETRLVGGTDDNWHLVGCRFKDEGNTYWFGISADGYYTINKEVNGKVEVLVAPTRSVYIHQGRDVTNLIHVECIGSSLSLSVNGHLLRKVTDATFTGGDIALGANSLAGTFTEVAFDNLTVTKP